MPISYYIEDKSRVVFTKFEGVVTIEELVNHQSTLGNDDDFDPNGFELIDARDGKPSKEVCFSSLLHITHTSPWMSDAHRAVVTSSPLIYGLANIYRVAMNGTHGAVSVFNNMESALRWLEVDGSDQAQNRPQSPHIATRL